MVVKAFKGVEPHRNIGAHSCRVFKYPEKLTCNNSNPQIPDKAAAKFDLTELSHWQLSGMTWRVLHLREYILNQPTYISM